LMIQKMDQQRDRTEA
jgi:hypothetical protein